MSDMISERPNFKLSIQDISEIDNALFAVREELLRATAKFGRFKSSHEGYAVILEEMDEFWDEVKCNDREAACAEVLQVAAMATRFLVDLGVQR